ncbi:MAG: potassium transporter TrkG, partial [bacterium]
FSLQCACAGSTSGGIKTDRMVILAKAFARQIKHLQHPRAIIPIRLYRKNIYDDVLAMNLLYVCVYLSVVFLATLAQIALGMDSLSAFSGTVAATGNVGPGLGTVGSMSNFSAIPDLGKWILTFSMLLGRLEIYGLIVFFLPHLWKMKTTHPTE